MSLTKLLRRPFCFEAVVAAEVSWRKFKRSLGIEKERVELMLQRVRLNTQVRVERFSYHCRSVVRHFSSDGTRALVAPCGLVLEHVAVVHRVHLVSLASCDCCASFVPSFPRPPFERGQQA